MNYTKNEILRDVRIALDENITNNELFANDTNTLTLDEIITQKITHAIRLVLEYAPIEMVGNGINFTSNITWDSRIVGCGAVQIPDDFIRLVMFKMDDWDIPVTSTISDTDIRYMQQRSKFAGIRGSAERPVCVITRNATGRVLEFYSSLSNSAEITIAKYICEPSLVADVVDIPERLYLSSIYQIAGLTALTYKDQHSDALFNIAKGYLDTSQQNTDS